jgi:hypothetical protein
MPRLLSAMIIAAAIGLGGPVNAQMHEGSRGGGGGFHGGGTGGRHGGGSPRANVGTARGTPAPAPRGGTGQYEYHGRAFSSLSPSERTHWANGEWRHVVHNGVFGWWWFLDDDWFYYPEATYPYPPYIAPLLSAQETPPMPPAQPYWYYCPNPSGYYPYVPACPIGWQMVPPVPTDAPAGAPPPPPPPESAP